MKSLVLASFLALSILVAGCASGTKTIVNEDGSQTVVAEDAFLDKLSTFTKNDVQTAMKLAGDDNLDGVVDEGVPGDPIALQCYAYLNTKLGVDRPGITVAGVISGFQAARNIKRRIGGGLSDEFTLGCGALLTDVRGSILKLGARVALPF